jgi:hypothetical protein
MTTRVFNDHDQIAELLATTRLVGVECPGRHSVYSQVTLHYKVQARDGAPAVLSYSVTGFDSRFNLLMMNIAAPGMTGTVRAFVRPSPREQVDYAMARRLVQPGEFAAQRALVVGGSRGLGEVTAKLLAAGGADVRITYFRGAEDARRVVGEIVAGGGAANSLSLDVLALESESSGETPEQCRPTHLYYFATPFIAPGERGTFSADRFSRLLVHLRRSAPIEGINSR